MEGPVDLAEVGKPVAGPPDPSPVGRGPSVDRLLSAGRLSATTPWILGVMVFLATLATGATLSGARAAVSLRQALDGRRTVQVVEADPVARSAAAVRALAFLEDDPAVAEVTLVPEAEVRSLVGPYLGTDRLDAELPVPALLDVTLADPDQARADGTDGRLARELRRIAPAVRLDRSADWAEPVRRFLTLAAALAAAVLLLAVAAMTAAVVLAARAALDAHRPTIATLHLLGATDRQVARLFERRVVRDAVAGIAVGWAIGAALFLGVAGWMASLGLGMATDETGGAGVERWAVALATLAVPLGAVALTRLSTGWTVRGSLRRMR